jgi:transposase
MKRFIEGAERHQSTLLPECLEDWIAEDNPVRAVDAFVDGLDCWSSASQVPSLRRPAGRAIIRRRS